MPWFSKWSHSLKFPTKALYISPSCFQPKLCIFSPIPHTCYVHHPSDSFWFDNPRDVCWAIRHEALHIALSPSHIALSPSLLLTSTLLGSNVFLSTPFSKTFSLCYSFCVRDQVLSRYQTSGDILYYIERAHRKSWPAAPALGCNNWRIALNSMKSIILS